MNSEAQSLIDKNIKDANIFGARMLVIIAFGSLVSIIALLIYPEANKYIVSMNLVVNHAVMDEIIRILVIVVIVIRKGKGKGLKYFICLSLLYTAIIISFCFLNIAWMIFSLCVIQASRYTNARFTMAVGIICTITIVATALGFVLLNDKMKNIDLNYIVFSHKIRISVGTGNFGLSEAVQNHGDIDIEKSCLKSLSNIAAPAFTFLFVSGILGYVSYYDKKSINDKIEAANRLVQNEIEQNKKYEAMIEMNTIQAQTVAEAIHGGFKIGYDDHAYTFKYVSEQLAAMAGYTVEEFMEASGGAMKGIVNVDDAMKEIPKAVEAIENGELYTMNYRLRCKDGSWKYVEDKGRLIQRADGTAEYWSFVVDKDELAKKEEALEIAERSRAELAEYNAIISYSGIGIWFLYEIDGERMRVKANDKMLEILGIEDNRFSEEDLYEYWYGRTPEDQISLVNESFDEMRDGSNSEITYVWNHPKKGHIYVRCGGSAEGLDNGYIFSGYFAEVTEIVEEDKKQKAALADALASAEYANRSKTVFLNNMSHDIRTPMNAIIGFTSLAQEHLDNPDILKDYLSKISISSNHLLSLVNDVLDMSRIESGQANIVDKEVHIPDIIHELKTIIQANINEKNQKLYIETCDIVNEDVITDKLRLNQILLNIVSNANKYTGEGGTISIRVSQFPSEKEGYADYEFRIKDNGIGMSKEFQNHIYEAFTRAKTSTVSGIQGTGLGMAITKNLVDLLDGTIELISEEGKGSEFIVTLSFKINENVKKPEKIEQLQNVRVLIADDDVHSCMAVSSILRDYGMKPEWTTKGTETILRAKEAMDSGEPFGAFVIDWMMPDLNGVEAVKRLRQLVDKNTPVIIITAYDWSEIENEAREAGVTEFCAKPVFMSELCEALSRPYVKAENVQKVAKIDFAGKKILLVEDNELNQEIAVALLEQYGFRVDVVGDGVQAVEKISESDYGDYDIILMDIQMPKMDGYEATIRIRDMENAPLRDIPILAMTANAFEEDKIKAFEAGMNGHISKPINVQKLISTLNDMLG